MASTVHIEVINLENHRVPDNIEAAEVVLTERIIVVVERIECSDGFEDLGLNLCSETNDTCGE